MNVVSQRSYRWLFCMLAVVGFTVDLGSKYFVFSHLYNEGRGDQIEVIPGAFSLVATYSLLEDEEEDWLAPLRRVSGPVMPHVNRGALFGIGQSANLFFGLVSVIAALAIIYWSTRPDSGRHGFLCSALGLILGGTLGNLYDRIVFGGVRDFLYWYKWVDWPVFNVADCCLVVGAGMLLIEALFTNQQSEANSTAAAQETAPAKEMSSVS